MEDYALLVELLICVLSLLCAFVYFFRADSRDQKRFEEFKNALDNDKIAIYWNGEKASVDYVGEKLSNKK